MELTSQEVGVPEAVSCTVSLDADDDSDVFDVTGSEDVVIN